MSAGQPPSPCFVGPSLRLRRTQPCFNPIRRASFKRRPRVLGESNPDLLSQDGFRLTLTGEFGAAREILGSTDWSGWTPLGTVTNT